MEGKKSVLMVDDHRLFREGLKARINSGGMFELIGEAGSSSEAWRMPLELTPFDTAILFSKLLPVTDSNGQSSLIRGIIRGTPYLIAHLGGFLSRLCPAEYAAGNLLQSSEKFVVPQGSPGTLMPSQQAQVFRRRALDKDSASCPPLTIMSVPKEGSVGSGSSRPPCRRFFINNSKCYSRLGRRPLPIQWETFRQSVTVLDNHYNQHVFCPDT